MNHSVVRAMEVTDSLAGRARGEEMELRDNRDSVYDMNYEISVGFQEKIVPLKHAKYPPLKQRFLF